ncbi:ribonuclease M5 [Alkalicoccus daliensis]|uniref:Ribonuclease M5 n=2 Tax=Alkalicoccus daliensis TaxID=745820 RepID=A0A1H0KUB2_9BACI|nr:ribonuclease M5 [Alkalicoccus daliensis]
MPQMKEIIVVEGKNDTHTLKRYVACDTIETSGSGITKATIEKIRLASERRGVIIFTDPDFPGQKIRHIIEQAVPGCKHAFLPKHAAIDKEKGKVGIEHAAKEDILEALDSVKTTLPEEEREETPSWGELHEAGLLAGPGAREKRQKLGDELHIGYTNGKQLVKRLQQFQISRAEFYHAVQKLEEKE